MPANYKIEKKTELIRSLAAEFIGRESNRTSLITVTRVETLDNFKRATIFFTVLPENKENQVLDFVRRQIPEFVEFVKTKAKLRSIPFFTFEIDLGEKNRQNIDVISRNT